MPALLLACMAYLSVALPASTLGLLWPSMRLSFGQPVGALGILLVFGITASVISSVATGRVRVRTGLVVAAGTMLIAVALTVEAFAPSLWVMAIGTVLFGLGFGAIDTALNAHAARHFGARDINWMHASYGLGAIIGPLLVTAPGPGLLAVIGLMILGLAAAPIFPLLTLMTPQWADSAAGATRMVSLQVAASAAGSAALPAGLGLAIGAVDARVLAPSLLVLGLAMGTLYALLSRWSGPGARQIAS